MSTRKRPRPAGLETKSTRRTKRARTYARIRSPPGEKKYIDTGLDGTMDSSGRVVLCNALNLGNSSTTRIGQRIAVKSIQLRTWIVNGNAATNNARLSLVVDRQCNGAAATITNVFSAISNTSLRNLGYRNRFKVLVDEDWVFSGVNLDKDSNVLYDKYIKFKKPLMVDYTTTDAGDITDIVTNSILVFCYGSTANPNGPAIYGYCRVRYVDY